VTAASFAISLAHEAHGRLIVLHVMQKPVPENGIKKGRVQVSVAEAMQRLHDSVGKAGEGYGIPEVVVEFGEPADRIVAAAQERHADLIVLGVRGAAHPGAATHLERATAHKVVAHAACPVLTVRH
jgi:nucleotide-binding universal stress UspA family protein